MAAKKKAATSSLDTLTDHHTTLGLLGGELARDARLPWKTRKIFESFQWVVFEQVKALRSGDLGNVPDDFIDAAATEVEEAITAGRAASDTGTAERAALAAVETHQAIDAVDGILGNKSARLISAATAS